MTAIAWSAFLALFAFTFAVVALDLIRDTLRRHRRRH